MTDDTEFTIDVGTDALEALQETDEPLETALAIGSDLPAGTLSLAGGSVFLLLAGRSVARGQLRSIPEAIVGAVLFQYGLQKRHRNAQAAFEADMLDNASVVTEDQAHTAATRESPELDEQPREGSASDAETAGTGDDTGEIGFTHDEAGDRAEPRSKPDVDAATEDPRRETDDEDVEIDVSESALADEASEAAGPSPEQAQPAQTDATEPEEPPAEDASDMNVEPGEEDDTDSTPAADEDDEPEGDEGTDDETDR